ncbi:protein UpsX [Acidianus manzaensis]|uniref:Uncharacterized protein n=1 Tax=Acidianus manzaensis TaxID=282676 RepID=A0A1W6JZR4_9CREN|nr:hypothetical protein [Acidianus manzaensis]ARM75727.1 hypothetical protein B6F84_06525 [Acidianus manzaensis]
MHPIYKTVLSLDVPHNLQYSLLNISDTIFLESNALIQPVVSLYPKFKVDKENRWIFYANGKLLEFVDNKLSIIENNANIDANYIYYVNVEGKIEKIIEKNNYYVYNSEIYDKIIVNEQNNMISLLNKKKLLLFWNKMKLEYDTPRNIVNNKNGISLLYDDHTKVITITGEKIIEPNRIFLGYIREKTLSKTLDGKIMLDNSVIGICKDNTELIGANSDIIVIKCGNSIKYLKDSVWKEIATDSSVLDGFVNDNFIIIKSEKETKVFDKNLTPLYILNKCEAIANSKYIFLYFNKNFGIIDTLDNSSILKVEKNYMDKKSPLILYIIKYYYPEFTDLDVIKKSEEGKYTKFLVEPKLLGSKKAKVRINSPFFSTEAEIAIDSKEPYIKALGEIVRSNGNVLGTRMNSIIKLKLEGEVNTFLPYTILISYKNFHHQITFTRQKISTDVKIPVNIFDHKLKNDIIYIDVVKSGRNQQSEEILLPIIDITEDSTKWKKEIIQANKDIVIKRLSQNTDDITWEKNYIYPTHRKGIIIKPKDTIINTNNVKYRIKRGINYINDYIIIGIDNIVNKLDISIDFPYLIISPNIQYNYPVEIFYSTYTYRGFPTKVVFPIDPAYDKIIVRTYIGNETVERTFKISKDMFIKIGLLQAKKIEDYLKSIGID